MSRFVANYTGFSAECVLHGGQCAVVRKNVVFLEDGDERAAVAQLQSNCGYVVIIPDGSGEGTALLYHTSCPRMTDAVNQLFGDSLDGPVSLPQRTSEMSLGELHRRRVGIRFEECRTRVDGFAAWDEPQG